MAQFQRRSSWALGQNSIGIASRWTIQQMSKDCRVTISLPLSFIRQYYVIKVEMVMEGENISFHMPCLRKLGSWATKEAIDIN